MISTQKRERERLPCEPEWNEEYQKWTRSFIKGNKWRVDPILSEDDLLQEAWFTFKHLVDTYPRIIDQKQFFNYYKRAIKNKMHDKSCWYSRRRGTVEAPISTDIYEVFAGRIGEVTNHGYLNALLNEAPEELKLVMALLAKGDLDKLPANETGVRENLNMKIKRFLNKEGIFNAFAQDPVNEIRQLLT